MNTATFQFTITTTHDLAKRPLAEVEKAYAEGKDKVVAAFKVAIQSTT